jgi:PAS domain S-box-containing protein
VNQITMGNKTFHNTGKLITQDGTMAVTLLSNINGKKKTGSNYGYPGKPITEIITNGFFTVDRKWTVTYWNKAAEELLGVKTKDIIGKNLWEKFAGIIPLDFYAVYHKAFLRDVPVHFKEYWGEKGAWFDVITYHSDDILSVSFKSSARTIQSGQLPQPAQPGDELKILNELYRFVTEVTNDCLWEWNFQTKEIFWIDGGHKRVFGYPVENALIPQSFWESRLHPDDKIRILTRLNKIITEGSVCVWEDEYRFQKANGGYVNVHDRGHIIYDGNYKASRMIGATQDITEKSLLQNKLIAERVTRQKELTAAVFTAQEKERADIGKELHDNLGQILAVTKMYMQMARKSEQNREMYFDKSCDFIEDVIQKVRRIAKNLIIPGAHIIGLFDNIKNLLQDLALIQPVKIEFHTNGINEKEINENLQLIIFRIIQEHLNNILKHANAKHAAINLSRQANEIILLISDNGKGFDILKQTNGVGIINIKSRAELYHGNATIISEPGKGYELKVILPLNEDLSFPLSK